jgi:hypothetical protein
VTHRSFFAAFDEASAPPSTHANPAPSHAARPPPTRAQPLTHWVRGRRGSQRRGSLQRVTAPGSCWSCQKSRTPPSPQTSSAQRAVMGRALSMSLPGPKRNLLGGGLTCCCLRAAPPRATHSFQHPSRAAHHTPASVGCSRAGPSRRRHGRRDDASPSAGDDTRCSSATSRLGFGLDARSGVGGGLRPSLLLLEARLTPVACPYRCLPYRRS